MSTEQNIESLQPDIAGDLAALPGADAPSGAALDPQDSNAGNDVKALRRFDDPVRSSIIQRYSESNREADATNPAAAEATRAALPPDMGGTPDEQAGSPDRGPDGASASAAAPDGSRAETALPEVVTVKVYGQELQVPKAAVDAAGGVAAFQKQAAVDEQLRRASLLTKQLEAQLAASAAAPPVTAATPPPSGERVAVGGTDAAREAMEALLESDADRFSAALGKAIEGTVQSRISTATPAAPAAAAPAPMFERTAEEIMAANQVFDTEFSAIRSNPAAMKAAQDLMRVRMTDPAFAAVPLEMLARDVGARMAAVVGASPSSSAPQPSTSADQLALRRTVKSRLPVGPSATPSRTPAQTRPAQSYAQANSSYIASLRARSGSNSAIAERSAR